MEAGMIMTGLLIKGRNSVNGSGKGSSRYTAPNTEFKELFESRKKQLSKPVKREVKNGQSLDINSQAMMAAGSSVQNGCTDAGDTSLNAAGNQAPDTVDGTAANGYYSSGDTALETAAETPGSDGQIMADMPVTGLMKPEDMFGSAMNEALQSQAFEPWTTGNGVDSEMPGMSGAVVGMPVPGGGNTGESAAGELISAELLTGELNPSENADSQAAEAGILEAVSQHDRDGGAGKPEALKMPENSREPENAAVISKPLQEKGTEQQAYGSGQPEDGKERSLPNENQMLEKLKDEGKTAVQSMFDKLACTKVNESFSANGTEPGAKTSVPVMEQLKGGLDQGLKDGMKEFTIRLKPEGLGDIVIRLVSAGGKVAVHMGVSNPETEKLITSQMADLKQLLEPHHAQIEEVYHDSRCGMGFNSSSQDMYGQQSGRRAFHREVKHLGEQDGEFQAEAEKMMAEGLISRLYAYI